MLLHHWLPAWMILPAAIDGVAMRCDADIDSTALLPLAFSETSAIYSLVGYHSWSWRFWESTWATSASQCSSSSAWLESSSFTSSVDTCRNWYFQWKDSSHSDGTSLCTGTPRLLVLFGIVLNVYSENVKMKKMKLSSVKKLSGRRFHSSRRTCKEGATQRLRKVLRR